MEVFWLIVTGTGILLVSIAVGIIALLVLPAMIVVMRFIVGAHRFLPSGQTGEGLHSVERVVLRPRLSAPVAPAQDPIPEQKTPGTLSLAKQALEMAPAEPEATPEPEMDTAPVPVQVSKKKTAGQRIRHVALRRLRKGTRFIIRGMVVGVGFLITATNLQRLSGSLKGSTGRPIGRHRPAGSHFAATRKEKVSRFLGETLDYFTNG